MGLLSLLDFEKKIKDANKIIIFFGPEGGITEEEFSFLVEKGFNPISLGDRVVKAEIAVLYGASIIRFLKKGKL
jgi:16S rRNA (uracil1498-N3)-methyltransferase